MTKLLSILLKFLYVYTLYCIGPYMAFYLLEVSVKQTQMEPSTFRIFHLITSWNYIGDLGIVNSLCSDWHEESTQSLFVHICPIE